ncbi:MAG TPA: hypothetical protein VE978_18990 [Chitinophagales bacterium]|nr:hypothetical protein [Chitinophagales bacterium]
MALSNERLRILTFPQRVRGNTLDVNVLVLPTQGLLNFTTGFPSVLNQGTTVMLPEFINVKPDLKANLVKGLNEYPFTTIPTDNPVFNIVYPENLPQLYEGLAAQFNIVSSASSKATSGAPDVKPAEDGIRKYLPLTYRNAFNFSTPRTPYARTDDSYHCAIKRAPANKLPFTPSNDEIAWGRVIAYCLRQPLLAEKIGLIYKLEITLPAANYLEHGGWIYFSLNGIPAEYHAAAADIKIYAARIPAIANDRQVFAALQFPVVALPGDLKGQFDFLKIEAADYDDGFAKIVHANQPVSANLLSEEPDGIHVQKEIGIQLGWDDEQILIWQNRQVLADPAIAPDAAHPNGQRVDAPLGVFSYRVDVREAGKPGWFSLVNTISKTELVLAGQIIAPAETPVETGVQVFPTKINAELATKYWLPSYFTQWYGKSLVLPDRDAAQLDKTGLIADSQKNAAFDPVLPDPDDCELKYGHEFEFRVRLADLSGGGPLVGEEELNDAPATSASTIFKRYVAPKQLKLNPLTPQSNPAGSATQTFYDGNLFEVSRPRLGYPALLFTEMDTDDAFQKLVDDAGALNPGGVATGENREVGYFDPDVTRFMVIVEVKSLLMDNLLSLNQREPYIPLYTTFREFDADPEAPFELQLEYRDANVIDFGNEINFGDLQISQAEIDMGDVLVLPTTRDIRITLLPVCDDKAALTEYFGFEKTLFAENYVRTGEPMQFFVREDSVEENDFFKVDLQSKQLKGIYLQPDPVQVNNVTTFIRETVEGHESAQNTVMQRLASNLDLNFKGMTLIGKPGERIQFGCSNRIRHTLAPDNSSLTFATKAELYNHWLCVASFEINRDWSWDGMDIKGVEILRRKLFTDEETIDEEKVGFVKLVKTASRLSITKPNLTSDVDRSYTRIVFIDAVEPKKDADNPATALHPFPNTIDVAYTLTPIFISTIGDVSSDINTVEVGLRLPVTTNPVQVPKVVAAGIALAPYEHNDAYSETTARERYLWFEFEEPIQDPDDSYFARVLNYAPDPLLSFPNTDQFIKQDDLPLPIDPELIRVITADEGNDNAGLDAMQMMKAETPDPLQALIEITPVHYLLPLPPGLHNESNELFGFFVYELRVGHTEEIWSTAQGRFGHPTRVNGVQHPAPPLKCLVNRLPSGITVTAQYAAAVFNGRNVTSKPPKTEIWCMLYAQAEQADGSSFRNILLDERKLQFFDPKEQVKFNQLTIEGFLKAQPYLTLKQANGLTLNVDAPSTGKAFWETAEINAMLDQFSLSHDIGLSVLAVEMMPRYDQYILQGKGKSATSGDNIRPLSENLGQYRILRTSRLVEAPEVCCEDCD